MWLCIRDHSCRHLRDSVLPGIDPVLGCMQDNCSSCCTISPDPNLAIFSISILFSINNFLLYNNNYGYLCYQCYLCSVIFSVLFSHLKHNFFLIFLVFTLEGAKVDRSQDLLLSLLSVIAPGRDPRTIHGIGDQTRGSFSKRQASCPLYYVCPSVFVSFKQKF